MNLVQGEEAAIVVTYVSAKCDTLRRPNIAERIVCSTLLWPREFPLADSEVVMGPYYRTQVIKLVS